MISFSFRTAIIMSAFTHLMVMELPINLKMTARDLIQKPLFIEVQLIETPMPLSPVSKNQPIPRVAIPLKNEAQPPALLKRHSQPQHEFVQTDALEPIAPYTPVKSPPIIHQLLNDNETTKTLAMNAAPALSDETTSTSTESKKTVAKTTEQTSHAEMINNTPLKTGVSISASYAKNNRKPEYPTVSRRLNEQGTVVLKVLVKEDGTAGLVEIKNSSGFPLLDESAKNAVFEWHFNPAKIDGKAIDEIYVLSIPFILQN